MVRNFLAAAILIAYFGVVTLLLGMRYGTVRPQLRPREDTW